MIQLTRDIFLLSYLNNTVLLKIGEKMSPLERFIIIFNILLGLFVHPIFLILALCYFVIFKVLPSNNQQIPREGPPTCPNCGKRNYSIKPSGLQNSIQDMLPLWILATRKLRFDHTCNDYGYEWTEIVTKKR